MSYVDQRMGSGRIASIVIVAVLHALLGYALVTGLAYNAVKQAVEDLKTFDVKEPPPPEEPPPPPDKIDMPPPPPQVTTPPPMQRIPIVAQAPVYFPPTPPTPPPPPPPAPPPPPQIKPARAKADLRGLFSTDDYPESARQASAEGTVRVSFVVGANGRASSCSVVKSSGSSALDNVTCRIITSKARFTPATDSTGAAVSDTQTSPPITWRLPKD